MIEAIQLELSNIFQDERNNRVVFSNVVATIIGSVPCGEEVNSEFGHPFSIEFDTDDLCIVE